MSLSQVHYLPLAPPFFIILVGLFVIILVLIQLGVLRYAYMRLGISPGAALLLLFASLIGSYFNIPVATENLSRLPLPFPLFHEEGLAVRKRRARRKAVGTRTPILNLDSAIVVMQSAEQSMRRDVSAPLNWAREGRVLVQPLLLHRYCHERDS